MWHPGAVSTLPGASASGLPPSGPDAGARELDDDALGRVRPRRDIPSGALPGLGWVAFALPAAVGIWHAAPAPLWRDDASAVALFSGTSRFQGVVSGALGQIAQLLPVGSGLERAALPGALALGALGYLVFESSSGLLRSRGAPRLAPVLSLSAAVTAALSASALSEGTVTGGYAVAAALGLGVLASSGLLAPPSVSERALGNARRAAVVALLFALTALESLWAAAAVGPALLVGLWTRGVRPGRAQALAFGAALALTTTVGVLPAALRPLVAPLGASISAGVGGGIEARSGGAPALGPRPTESASPAIRPAHTAGSATPPSDVSSAVSNESSAAEPQNEATRFLTGAGWLDGLGLLALAAAAVGAATALLQRKLRAALAPAATLLAFDLLVPSAMPDALSVSGRVAPHLLALAVIVVIAAIGVHALVSALSRLRFPGARPSAALLVAFALAASWAGAEDSMRLVGSRNPRAAEVWTDEAFAALPPRALVVVRSEPLAFRLWAAHAIGGRSDVLVVPLPLLGRGTLAADLLELEPKLALLIRELSISGVPSEQALTELADARPLFVDVDPTWDRRLLEHLLPGPFFSRFAPHALGRSDRKLALEASLDTFESVLARADGGAAPDLATRSVLLRGAEQELALLEALGDRAEAKLLRARLAQIAPSARPEPVPVASR